MDWKKLSTKKIYEVYSRLFLNRCYLCDGKSENTLCFYCQEGLPLNTNSCHHCKLPTQTISKLCGQCQILPPSYHFCIAPYRFEGIVKILIHNIKFNQGNYYIRPLTYLLSDHLIKTYSSGHWPEQILYVPSHPSRIKERGFCQTRAMSTHLIKNLQQRIGEECPALPKQNPIQKIKHTQAQHSLGRKERFKSPQNSYRVDTPIARHIALLDDVMTTGSTVENCTKLLLKAGAERVDVWVIARTPDKEH